MTHSGSVDYDQVARAQALLLDRRRLSPAALISTYRTLRAAMPGVYTDKFTEALLSQGYALSREARMTVWAEAVDVVRPAAQADPHLTELFMRTLKAYQRGLSDAGRRAEALQICREIAAVGKRDYLAGKESSPTSGTSSLAYRLAEDGEHAEAAELFEAMYHDDTRPSWHRGFSERIGWIAELEAAGEHETARNALEALVDEDREGADALLGPYAHVIWEMLLLASMDREHGRAEEAEHCDRAVEALLTTLAADGEPKKLNPDLTRWAALAALTGRNQDRPAPGEPEAPVFAHFHLWSPDVQRAYLEDGFEQLVVEMQRIAVLAADDPGTHLGHLVEVERKVTLRAVRHWDENRRHKTDALRRSFESGTHLARRLVDIDEPAGRVALSRALADRTSLHIAMGDYPLALNDFRKARLVAAGARIA